MNSFKPWISGFVVLSLLRHNWTMETWVDEDFSHAEKLLHHYHIYVGELKWKWSVKPFCRAMCPGEFGVDHVYTYVEKRKVMLESANCTRIEAEILTCGCETREAEENAVHMFYWFSLLDGPNGEIFQVQSPFDRTKCDDEKTYTIFRAIVRGRAYIPEGPTSLRGVRHIFEEIVQKGFNILYHAGTKPRSDERLATTKEKGSLDDELNFTRIT